MNNYYIDINDKFKTNYLMVRYFMDVTKKNASYASLLSSYLGYVNKNQDTFKKAVLKFDSLYGAKFDVNVSIKANVVVFDFIINFISNRYLNDENYLEEVMKVYLDYIFNPLINDDGFDKEIFNLKKYELIERIKSSYDDKMIYALEQFLEVFAQDTPLKYNNVGDISIIEKINEKELLSFYNDMIKTVPLVYFQVNESDKSIISYLQEYVKVTDLEQKYDFYHLEVTDVNEVIEAQDLVQSKLVMGYVIDKVATIDDYYATLMFNALLGMGSSSYLFKIIREKENLCYGIRSNYDYYSNTIVILAGIEKKNYEKTVMLTNQIVSDMADGKISEEDFNDAKIVLIDIINKMNDSQGGYINYIVNRNLAMFPASLEDDIERISLLKLEDIIEIAKSVKLTTKYLLSGDKDE